MNFGKWGRWSVLAALTCACGSEATLQPCDPDPQPSSDGPVITSISPPGGPPGTTVTIRGENFMGITDQLQVAYGDYSESCEHTTLAGELLSDSTIQVTIPDDALTAGFLYVLIGELTASVSPQPFALEPPAQVVVQNLAQFPIVSARLSWEPVLDAGESIDVEATRTWILPVGPMLFELCTGFRSTTGQIEEWACVERQGRLTPGQVLDIVVPPITAAHFLQGEWISTWQVGEGDDAETFEERLYIDADGDWELRYQGRIIEAGRMVEPTAWPAYVRDFEFALRPTDAMTQASLPVRSFGLYSERARDRVAFFRNDM